MNASLAIIHNQLEFDFVENIAVTGGKSIWTALKSNGSGLQWINEQGYENHQWLSDIDTCMVTQVYNTTIAWQLKKCVNKDNFYPLCMLGKLIYESR